MKNLMNTFTVSQITDLAKNTSRLQFLQLTIECHEKRYNEIKSKRAEIWKLYDEAIDNQEPAETVRKLGATAMQIENAAGETWLILELAKRELVARSN